MIGALTLLLAAASAVRAAGQGVQLAASDYVGSHNTQRTKYGVSQMVRSLPLSRADAHQSDIASLASNTLAYASKCKFEHSGIDGYGENIAACGSSNGYPPVDFTGCAMNGWMDEASAYYSGDKNFEDWGHCRQAIMRC